MTDTILNYVIGGCFTLLTSLFIYLTRSIKAIVSGTRAMLRYRIGYNCDYYLMLGCITIDELGELKNLQVPYKKLNGNGKIDIKLKKVDKLPIVTREELEHIKIEKFSK